ncbi:MAG: triose-phosphate isomerase [Oligoflexia bacterium]|nr:triose-phosphate isomerase [Oligoflexia bacterium]
MRKKIFAGNWKMHHGPKETLAFLKEFKEIVAPDAHREWVFFPPFVNLMTMQETLNGSFIKWGGQNCHFEQKGAFTGEISPMMLKELGCTYTLVGHSERRQIFGETDSLCAKKVKALNEAGVIPMLCVGETQNERDENLTSQVLKKQLHEGLSLWDPSQPLTLAYEPVWAIGTGKVASPAQAEEAHQMIRQVLSLKYGPARSAEIQILYGGSVKPDNSRELSALPNIDGFLVGKASLIPKTFALIGQTPL